MAVPLECICDTICTNKKKMFILFYFFTKVVLVLQHILSLRCFGTYFTDILCYGAQVWHLWCTWLLKFLPETRCPETELLGCTVEFRTADFRLLSVPFIITSFWSFWIFLEVNMCKTEYEKVLIKRMKLKCHKKSWNAFKMHHAPNTDQLQEKRVLTAWN